jgi:hypothetical protein
MRHATLLAISLTLATLLPLPACAQVILSEFMANNTRTLADDDGDYSDWIELQNRGPAPVSLLDWSLTDSTSNPTKWRFPEVTLAPGDFLVVFASGKDHRDPSRPLHTSFKLSTAGDYLALVMPDGRTVATEFRPKYPPQLADVSYGFGSDATPVTLVSSGSSVRLQVPTVANGGDVVGDAWIGGSEPFDDSGWTPGVFPVGFATVSTNVVGGTSLATRLDFNAAPVLDVVLDARPTASPRNATNHGATWMDYVLEGVDPARGREGVMAFDGTRGDQVVLDAGTDLNGTKGAVALWLKTDGNTGPGAVGAVVFDRRSTRGDVLVIADDGHLMVQAWGTGGVLRNGFRSNRAITDALWHHVVYNYDNTATGFTALYVDGVLDRSEPVSGSWSWDAARPLEIGRSHDPAWRAFDGYLDDFRFYKRLLTATEVAQLYAGDGARALPSFATDLAAAMAGVNATVRARVAFVVPDPAAYGVLALRMRYDDGFVAYVNGVEVAHDQAPDFPEWNSSAAGSHDAAVPETYVLGDVAHLLRAGTNVLCLQGLNLFGVGGDFFLSAELIGYTRDVLNPVPRYFQSPSPGGPNIGGARDLGPILSAAVHAPRVPGPGEALTVTVRADAAFAPVKSVVMNYRVNFGVTNRVDMADDGQHGDGAAGDGVFGAVIPGGTATNGQMIRFYFVASDTQGRSSRWPLFEDPLESEEYLGTVVADPSRTTRLPVYQLFVKTPANMDLDAGTQASFFYNGDLYDNVLIRLKGGTTRGLNKKAHRVNFHRVRPFAYDASQPPIRELALNAEFIDPSFLRQDISFWLFNQAGTPAPIHFPVRLELNGQFHELAFHTETMDNAMISRMGLNGDGALYKNALMLNIIPESAIGGRDCLEAEKQTRQNEGYGDLIAWTTGLAETNSVDRRRTHLFDTTDIPSVINYLACFHITQQADGVHANVCPQRDTGGTDEWRLIPWDMNLSMGQVWATDHVTGNEDTAESHPFYGASGWRDSNIPWSYNRLFDSLIVVPELREMYLRRLRTLMDEWLQPPGTPAEQLRMDNRVLEMRALIEPEALADRKKWGWPEGYGGYTMTNVPFGQAIQDLLNGYLKQRRTHFYGLHNVANAGYANRAGIPDSQSLDVILRFGSREVVPASGDPAQAFFELQNTNGFAVDISGWQVAGDAAFVFRPGTVLPSGGSVFVSPDVKAFRARSLSPRGRESRFVQGPWKGQLNARGGGLTLRDRCDRVVDSVTWPDQSSAAQQALRITEIMYAPPPGTAGGFGAEDYEFLELANLGPSAVDLPGVRVTAGVAFDFGTSVIRSLAPGARVVLVHNVAAFRARYGDGPVVAGAFTGSLANEGETVRLVDAAGQVIQEISYDPAWYPVASGLGFSLVAADGGTAPSGWSNPGGWRPSAGQLGSPGVADSSPASPGVQVTEVLSNPVAGGADAIEVFNPGPAVADVSGWYLTDDPSRPRKYRLPKTVLAPGGFMVVGEAAFNHPAQGTNAFALSAAGDQVYLFAADAAGALTGYSDGFAFGAALEGVTFGRWLDSSGQPWVVPLSQATPGAPNTGPRVGPVVLGEVFYHGDGVQEEYLELVNTSALPVAMFDELFPTNRWRLRGDVDFDFPAGASLEAGKVVVVVGFDPVADPGRLAAFTLTRGVPASAAVVGPYRGHFSHGGGTLRLEAPGHPVVEGGEIRVPWAVVEEITFDDRAPWPDLADGRGAALVRRDVGGLALDPASWMAAVPSPGVWSAPGLPPHITGQPGSLMSALGAGGRVGLLVTAGGAGPLSYQWLRDGIALPGATNDLLVIGADSLDWTGCYEAVVMNAGGAVRSAVAPVTIAATPVLTLQPTSRVVAAGSNVVVRAGAIGVGVVHYQWRYNDSDLPGATDPVLALNGMQVSQSGRYQLRVTDDLGVAFSDPVSIIAAVRPAIVVPPVSASVVAGDAAVFSVTATGSPPLTFRWKRGAVVVATVTQDAATGFLQIPVAQPAQAAANYTVSVANVLGTSASSPSFALTLLADADGDGLPDAWEVAHGLDPKTPDAGADPDGDGVSNRDEYLSGTDPRDGGSRLELSLRLVGDTPSIEFIARSNVTYTVQATLGLNPPAWQRLGDVAARSTNRLERVLDGQKSFGPRYYRLVTPWQP